MISLANRIGEVERDLKSLQARVDRLEQGALRVERTEIQAALEPLSTRVVSLERLLKKLAKGGRADDD
jgi:hypothetical protein